jgi:heme/copper-type cytochrome/quinol oxidase subunit 4
MKSERTPKREARVLAATWVALVSLTLGSFWLSDADAVSAGQATAWLLGFAALKSHLIAGVFMDMGRGPRAWAAVMSGFLLFEVALIGVILP